MFFMDSGVLRMFSIVVDRKATPWTMPKMDAVILTGSGMVRREP